METEKYIEEQHKIYVEWVAENVLRNVRVEDLSENLKTLNFSDELINTIIQKGFIHNVEYQPIPKPEFEYNTNSFKHYDRDIDVVIAMDDPKIYVFDNVLSKEECDILIKHGEHKVYPMASVGEDGTNIYNEFRTCYGTFFDKYETDLIANIEERLVSLVNWENPKSENLQFLIYDIGQEHQSHYDFFDFHNQDIKRSFSSGGQRVGTFVVYLNDVPAGGGTKFTKLNLTVKPKTGRVLYFSNISNGVEDYRMEHAATPVIEGRKFALTKWLRQDIF